MMSSKYLGRCLPEEQKRRISKTMKGKANNNRRSWTGGETGEFFASILCPAGFTREYFVKFGVDRYDITVMDFAHVAGKVNIELDGPFHVATHTRDTQRDTALKKLGWKVIRVKHN
jgi:very-short-patch-repair endonuclease